MKNHASYINKSKIGAFTLIELLVVIAVIGILAALLLPVFSRAKKQTTSVICLNNLKQLGTAMSLYSHDSGDRLPYAAIRMFTPTLASIREMTWDSLLNRYIGGKLTEEQLWNPLAARKVESALAVLKCPSDPTPRPDILPPPIPINRRSYSMPRYMDYDGTVDQGNGGRLPWPPSPQTQAGVGLNFSPSSPFWNEADNKTGDGSSSYPRPSHQMAIKTSMLPEPSGTILLTERIHCANMMGFGDRHDIRNAEDHMSSSEGKVYEPPYFYPPAASLHGGPFNYLMIDGHVQFLLPTKTTSDLGLQRGMWSIKAGD